MEREILLLQGEIGEEPVCEELEEVSSTIGELEAQLGEVSARMREVEAEAACARTESTEISERQTQLYVDLVQPQELLVTKA